MNDIRACIQVGADHRITGTAPADVPPGEHEVIIAVVSGRAQKRFRVADLPVHDTPWDGSISLRREEMHDGDGC